jgi:hypothetical protein
MTGQQLDAARTGRPLARMLASNAWGITTWPTASTLGELAIPLTKPSGSVANLWAAADAAHKTVSPRL